MSSHPSSPAAAPNSSQQQQSENNGQAPSSPQSKADSAVHVEETPERVDPDSSFQSNSSERHPKGKRKRTAAKDKAILEAAYNANPKPDKAARLDIVKRVSLNEKEVQIWFQNRRQNDRRKSRPLSPQEIAALQYGGMQVLSSSDPVQYSSQPQVSSQPNPITSPVPASSMPERENASPSSTAEPVRPSTAAENTVQAAEAHHIRRISTVSMPGPVAPSPQPVDFMANQPHQLYRSASVGYFANRHEFMSAARPSSTASVLPPPHASGFRLSMSMEGKAELRPQPSPPRVSPSAISDGSAPNFDRPNLHRSRSAAASITLPPISTLTASLEPHASPHQVHPPHQPQPRLPPRLHHVRSLDVHEWELACEAGNGELKDELTAYAERESSGSAIAAISLLRSLSSSSHSPMSPASNILQPNGAKRNARPHTQHQQAKRPKLNRASSSVGRLQTNFVNTTTDKPPVRREETPVDSDEPKKSKMSMLLSPGGDSDKENWNPHSIGNMGFRGAARPFNGRRPLPGAPLSKDPSTASGTPRKGMGRILGDASNRSFLGRANTAPSSRRKKGSTPLEIFEDGTGGVDASDDEDHERHGRSGVTDDEVERFMRGEVSPSKKGAASAIAGLLALSQGNWR
ncbi:Homeobox protein YOX1 [Cytospora mali]|uniref:Homeobox protein YOX1 n=1 Tax=Cytospora mali TaxID=578113 RepID=A0A194UQV9_CYTMA|nr:Homeobox protein YOX1 [Valsa mali var. pyri (nom. inval.)]